MSAASRIYISLNNTLMHSFLSFVIFPDVYKSSRRFSNMKSLGDSIGQLGKAQPMNRI